MHALRFRDMVRPSSLAQNMASGLHSLPSAEIDMHFSVRVVMTRVDVCRDIHPAEDKSVQARMRLDVRNNFVPQT